MRIYSLLSTVVSVADGDLKVEVVDYWFLKVDISWLKVLSDVSTLVAMLLAGKGVPQVAYYHPMIS